MKDNFGDCIEIDFDRDRDGKVVFLNCFESQGFDETINTIMSLSPKKARKLATQLFKAANKVEGKCKKNNQVDSTPESVPVYNLNDLSSAWRTTDVPKLCTCDNVSSGL